MEERILEAIEEMRGVTFETLEEAIGAYGKASVLDLWLRFEGIIGYTQTILDVIEELRLEPGKDKLY